MNGPVPQLSILTLQGVTMNSNNNGEPEPLNYHPHPLHPRIFTKTIKISVCLEEGENSVPVRASNFTNFEDGDASVTGNAQKSSDIESTTIPNGAKLPPLFPHRQQDQI